MAYEYWVLITTLYKDGRWLILKPIERALSYVNLILVQGGDQYSIARQTRPPFKEKINFYILLIISDRSLTNQTIKNWLHLISNSTTRITNPMSDLTGGPKWWPNICPILVFFRKEHFRQKIKIKFSFLAKKMKGFIFFGYKIDYFSVTISFIFEILS